MAVRSIVAAGVLLIATVVLLLVGTAPSAVADAAAGSSSGVESRFSRKLLSAHLAAGNGDSGAVVEADWGVLGRAWRGLQGAYAARNDYFGRVSSACVSIRRMASIGGGGSSSSSSSYGQQQDAAAAAAGFGTAAVAADVAAAVIEQAQQSQ